MSLLPEEKVINYLAKLYHERAIALELIKNHFSSPSMNSIAFAAVCEYIGTLQHMENLFDDIIEHNEYDGAANGYYINEKQEMGLLVFLQSVILIKEELLHSNVSLEIH